MNLLDVVPLAAPSALSKVALQHLETARKSSRVVAAIDTVNILATLNHPESHALKTVRSQHTEMLEAVRYKFFAETGTLAVNATTLAHTDASDKDIVPELYGMDTLGKVASEGPRVTTTMLRDVVDRLGFVLMPFEYLSDAGTKDAPPTAHRFRRFMREHTCYVVAPPVYYSIKNHVASPADLDVYAGTPVAQAFMAVGMTVPMFRTIVRDLADMRNTLREHSNRMDALNAAVENLSKRVARAEQELQGYAQRLEQLQAEAEKHKAAEVRRAVKDFEGAALAYDPLMFALPKGASLLDDVVCPLGPAWGPDFHDAVLPALGFVWAKNQRKRLEATFSKLY